MFSNCKFSRVGQVDIFILRIFKYDPLLIRFENLWFRRFKDRYKIFSTISTHPYWGEVLNYTNPQWRTLRFARGTNPQIYGFLTYSSPITSMPKAFHSIGLYTVLCPILSQLTIGLKLGVQYNLDPNVTPFNTEPWSMEGITRKRWHHSISTTLVGLIVDGAGPRNSWHSRGPLQKPKLFFNHNVAIKVFPAAWYLEWALSNGNVWISVLNCVPRSWFHTTQSKAVIIIFGFLSLMQSW